MKGLLTSLITVLTFTGAESLKHTIEEVKIWECRNCGHIVVGTAAPEVCPVCNHPQSYFELCAENY